MIDPGIAEGSQVGDSARPTISQVYETYRDRVLAYATRLIGRDAADDVAQEVFIKIGRSLESLTDPSRLPSWVYAITLNTVRDLARKQASLKERHASAAGPAAASAADDDPLERIPDTRSCTPEEAAMRGEMLGCYLDYVEALPANYLDVFRLSQFDELSNEDIARRLSLTVGTVKIRLHRARAKLFEQLRRDCQCYVGDRGELMARLKDGRPKRGGARRSEHAPRRE
jgi:RNA polymerase sigma-70 factor, ECF subfamily